MARKIVIPAAAPQWVQPYTQQLQGAFASSSPAGPAKSNIEDGTITFGSYVLFPTIAAQSAAVAASKGKQVLPFVEAETLDEASAYPDYYVGGVNATWTFRLPAPSNHVGSTTALRLTPSSAETRVDDRFAQQARMFVLYSDGSTWRMMGGSEFVSSGFQTLCTYGFPSGL